jgi:hypothetical protein
VTLLGGAHPRRVSGDFGRAWTDGPPDRAADPVQTPVDKVASALTAMAQIPTSVLGLAEKLPHVAKALIDAATKG